MKKIRHFRVLVTLQSNSTDISNNIKKNKVRPVFLGHRTKENALKAPIFPPEFQKNEKYNIFEDIINPISTLKFKAVSAVETQEDQTVAPVDTEALETALKNMLTELKKD